LMSGAPGVLEQSGILLFRSSGIRMPRRLSVCGIFFSVPARSIPEMARDCLEKCLPEAAPWPRTSGRVTANFRWTQIRDSATVSRRAKTDGNEFAVIPWDEAGGRVRAVDHGTPVAKLAQAPSGIRMWEWEWFAPLVEVVKIAQEDAGARFSVRVSV